MKYKSYAFWTSLAAAIVVLVGVIAGIFGFEADEKLITDIIMAICGILIVLGVVKMPIKEVTSSPEGEEQQIIENKKNDDKDDKTKD